MSSNITVAATCAPREHAVDVFPCDVTGDAVCGGPKPSETFSTGSPSKGQTHSIGQFCHDNVMPNDSISNGGSVDVERYLGYFERLAALGFSPSQCMEAMRMIAPDVIEEVGYNSSYGSTRSGVRKALYESTTDAMAAVEGYCYLLVVRRSKRTIARELLGAFPTFRKLLTLEADLLARGEWKKVYVSKVTSEFGPPSYHFSRDEVGPCFESVISAMTAAYGRVVPDQWISHHVPVSLELPPIVSVVGAESSPYRQAAPGTLKLAYVGEFEPDGRDVVVCDTLDRLRWNIGPSGKSMTSVGLQEAVDRSGGGTARYLYLLSDIVPVHFDRLCTLLGNGHVVVLFEQMPQLSHSQWRRFSALPMDNASASLLNEVSTTIGCVATYAVRTMFLELAGDVRAGNSRVPVFSSSKCYASPDDLIVYGSQAVVERRSKEWHGLARESVLGEKLGVVREGEVMWFFPDNEHRLAGVELLSTLAADGPYLVVVVGYYVTRDMDSGFAGVLASCAPDRKLVRARGAESFVLSADYVRPRAPQSVWTDTLVELDR